MGRDAVVKLVKRELVTSASAELSHINFTILLAFKFKENHHLDQHARVEASVPIPRNLPPFETWSTCVKESKSTIEAALKKSFLPHLSSFMKVVVAYRSARAALAFGTKDDLCSYKDVNVEISADLENQLVYMYKPSVTLRLILTDRDAYRAFVNKYKVPPETVTAMSCCICLEDFNGSEAALMPCKHVFHGPCVIEWLDGGGHGCPPFATSRLSLFTITARVVMEGLLDSN